MGMEGVGVPSIKNTRVIFGLRGSSKTVMGSSTILEAADMRMPLFHHLNIPNDKPSLNIHGA